MKQFKRVSSVIMVTQIQLELHVLQADVWTITVRHIYASIPHLHVHVVLNYTCSKSRGSKDYYMPAVY